jgi:hypothetical protein
LIVVNEYEPSSPVRQRPTPVNPLFALDPIYQAIVDPKARERLVANYDHDLSAHEWSLGYKTTPCRRTAWGCVRSTRFSPPSNGRA